MNVYEMYHDNDFKFGFYVVRNSWATVIAKVIKIENTKEGQKIPGKPPYFSNPKVMAEFYRVDDNFLIDADILIQQCTHENLISIDELRCPGTYAYSKI